MTFEYAAAWLKKCYPVNGQRYTVRLRRDLWLMLAHEMFMNRPVWFNPDLEDKPWGLLIRNVCIVPR